MTADPDFIDDTPVALTIAGSDCSAGAGLQADLKTFAALGAYGLSAVTCAVSEVPARVSRIEILPPDFVADQVRLLCESFPVSAVKTGMLYSAAHIRAVADALGDAAFEGSLVVDPVMVATSGAPLLEPDAVSAYREALFPKATVITPNLDEAAALLGRPLTTETDAETAARALAQSTGAAVLVTGGHLQEGTATDILCSATGGLHTFKSPMINGVHTHGTGCTCAAAIAAGLARRLPLVDAVAQAKTYVTSAIQTSHRWRVRNKTVHALNHRPS